MSVLDRIEKTEIRDLLVYGVKSAFDCYSDV